MTFRLIICLLLFFCGFVAEASVNLAAVDLTPNVVVFDTKIQAREAAERQARFRGGVHFQSTGTSNVGVLPKNLYFVVTKEDYSALRPGEFVVIETRPGDATSRVWKRLRRKKNDGTWIARGDNNPDWASWEVNEHTYFSTVQSPAYTWEDSP